MAALNSPRCGRGRLSFTFGSIRMQLCGGTLLRSSTETSIFRFFGVKSQSHPRPQKFRRGCRIFTLILSSYGSSIQILIGEERPTFLQVHLHADVKLSHSKNGRRWSRGARKRTGYLVISTSSH